ncbi:MAG: hypothetical protein OQK82_07980, partial [Candidatus Pacearchaeota archaeon]|nr:hypothetical protein [Candidatus Pacearchaeota archaeon]
MLPTVKALQKEARKRGAMLRKSESGLLSNAASMQDKLDSYIINTFLPSLDISNGQIKNTTTNLKKINKATGLKKFMRDVVNASMYAYYDKQFNSLSSQTTRYFNAFEPPLAAQKRITDRGTVIVDGFLNSLFDNNDIVRGLQNTLKNGVSTSMKTSEL